MIKTAGRRKRAWWLMALGVLAACNEAEPSLPEVPEDPDSISPLAAQYVDAAVDIMQAWSIKKYQIDWVAFRAATFADAGLARTTADTYDAIRNALVRIGDNHSFFQPPGGGQQAPPVAPPPAATQTVDPTAKLLEGALGYVSVTAFVGAPEEANLLATTYHRLLESVDAQGTCAWVVDLRGNTGGNMWPMVAGVGPVLGEGVVGYFVDPDARWTEWSYEDGASRFEGEIAAEADRPYEPQGPLKPVAVLTDGRTASSGEAATIAFRSRPDTRSFGTPTAGVSTANRGFQLSDGALLFLTVSTMADRDRRVYGLDVVPDEVIPGQKTGVPATDEPLRVGMDWLMSQPACTESGGP